MKLGESTGGRPPYEIEDEDLNLVLELSSIGMSLENIAKQLNISLTTTKDIIKRDNDFSATLRRGKLKYFLKCDKSAIKGEFPASLYIYFSKTKWKEFYPQEEKEKPQEQVQHSVLYLPAECNPELNKNNDDN